MRKMLALLCFAFAVIGSPSREMPLRNSSGGTPALTCSNYGSASGPAASGCTIYPSATQDSPIIWDAHGNSYQFKAVNNSVKTGNWLYPNSGNPTVNGSTVLGSWFDRGLEIQAGDVIHGISCADGLTFDKAIWIDASPGSKQWWFFEPPRSATSYRMSATGKFGTPGSHITINALPSGIPIWRSGVLLGGGDTNERVTLAPGAVIGCVSDQQGQGTFDYNDDKGQMDSWTLDGSGTQGYNRGPIYNGTILGLALHHATRWTIGSTTNGGPLIRDDDFGVEDSNTCPVVTGTTHGPGTSATTIDNIVIPIAGNGRVGGYASASTDLTQPGGFVGDKTTAGAGTIQGMTIHDTDGDIPAGARIVSVSATSVTLDSGHPTTNGHSGDTIWVDCVDNIFDTTFDHNGDLYNGNPNSTSHNVYLGTYTDTNVDRVAATNSHFECVAAAGTSQNNSLAGFELKTRKIGGVYQGDTFAGVDPLLGFSSGGSSAANCHESAEIDLACGGYHVFGGAGAGQGDVIEVGPGLGYPDGSQNGREAIRYMRDSNYTGTFTGSISGNVLTITANSNTALYNGRTIADAGTPQLTPRGVAIISGGNGHVATGRFTLNYTAPSPIPASGTTTFVEAGNCSAQYPNPGWQQGDCKLVFGANCGVVATRDIFINDSPFKINLITVDWNTPLTTTTFNINNSIIIGSWNGITMGSGNSCTVDVFGPGNTPTVIRADGGGNKCYPTRAAAAAAAAGVNIGGYPSLPNPL